MHQIASEAEERLAALGRDIRRCSTVVQPMDPEMVRLLGAIDRADAGPRGQGKARAR